MAQPKDKTSRTGCKKTWSMHNAMGTKEISLGDGKFDTKVTKQNTKSMHFDEKHYSSQSIPDTDAAEKFGPAYRPWSQNEDNDTTGLNDLNKSGNGLHEDYAESELSNEDNNVWTLRDEPDTSTIKTHYCEEKETVFDGILSMAKHDVYSELNEAEMIQDLDFLKPELPVRKLRCKDYEDMVNKFRPLITNNVLVRDILPHLPFIDDSSSIRNVDQFTSSSETMEKLLDTLMKSQELEKWNQFVKALRSAGYNYIVEKIKGYRVIKCQYQDDNKRAHANLKDTSLSKQNPDLQTKSAFYCKDDAEYFDAKSQTDTQTNDVNILQNCTVCHSFGPDSTRLDIAEGYSCDNRDQAKRQLYENSEINHTDKDKMVFIIRPRRPIPLTPKPPYQFGQNDDPPELQIKEKEFFYCEYDDNSRLITMIEAPSLALVTETYDDVNYPMSHQHQAHTPRNLNITKLQEKLNILKIKTKELRLENSLLESAHSMQEEMNIELKRKREMSRRLDTKEKEAEALIKAIEEGDCTTPSSTEDYYPDLSSARNCAHHFNKATLEFRPPNREAITTITDSVYDQSLFDLC